MRIDQLVRGVDKPIFPGAGPAHAASIRLVNYAPSGVARTGLRARPAGRSYATRLGGPQTTSALTLPPRRGSAPPIQAARPPAPGPAPARRRPHQAACLT